MPFHDRSVVGNWCRTRAYGDLVPSSQAVKIQVNEPAVIGAVLWQIPRRTRAYGGVDDAEAHCVRWVRFESPILLCHVRLPLFRLPL